MKIDLVPIGVMFLLDLGRVKDKVSFSRAFYGYSDNSYYGRYSYYRKGFLDSISHIRSKGIIVRKEDSRKLRGFLRNHKTSFTEHLIVLHAKEAKKLGVEYHKDWNTVMKDLKGDKDLLMTVEF
tara:strand:+ start:284 stop:655 length:372 start_codon:yes stop_codon:yes gene_type:complete